MLDITAPKHVEVTTSANSKVLWVNVDGECALRCCRIEHITLNGVPAVDIIKHDIQHDILTGKIRQLEDEIVCLKQRIEDYRADKGG